MITGLKKYEKLPEKMSVESTITTVGVIYTRAIRKHAKERSSKTIPMIISPATT